MLCHLRFFFQRILEIWPSKQHRYILLFLATAWYSKVWHITILSHSLAVDTFSLFPVFHKQFCSEHFCTCPLLHLWFSVIDSRRTFYPAQFYVLIDATKKPVPFPFFLAGLSFGGSSRIVTTNAKSKKKIDWLDNWLSGMELAGRSLFEKENFLTQMNLSKSQLRSLGRLQYCWCVASNILVSI